MHVYACVYVHVGHFYNFQAASQATHLVGGLAGRDDAQEVAQLLGLEILLAQVLQVASGLQKLLGGEGWGLRGALKSLRRELASTPEVPRLCEKPSLLHLHLSENRGGGYCSVG